VRAESTSAQWKLHASDTWRPLSCTVVSTEVANGQQELDALGHIPDGTAFTCSVSGLTDQAGVIDLRIHVEDIAGNALGYTLSPAFTIVAGGRSRSAGH
jgi:hypothetical protein